MQSVVVTKKIRQAKIAEVIEHRNIYSQQELAESLERLGIRVTQATLSRDLTELGVVKGPNGYEILHRSEAEGRESIDLRRVLREFVRSLDATGNLIVLRTDPGNAHTVAVYIDRAQWREIMGTIAGDDTIFIAVRRPRLVRKIMLRFEEVLNTNHDH